MPFFCVTLLHPWQSHFGSKHHRMRFPSPFSLHRSAAVSAKWCPPLLLCVSGAFVQIAQGDVACTFDFTFLVLAVFIVHSDLK